MSIRQAATSSLTARPAQQRPTKRRKVMTEFDGLPVLISVPRAAEILGLKRSSAYRLAASGELPSRRLGGRVYIVTAELVQLINGGGRVA